MKNFAVIMMAGIFGSLLFSCQNDMSEVVEKTDSVSVSTRATPSDAIELTPQDGILTLEGGKNYVIRGNVTATGFSTTTSSSNTASLYIEGSLTFPYSQAGGALVFPDGILTTIIGGGSMNLETFTSVILGNTCAIYVERTSTLTLGGPAVSFREGANEGSIINYGKIEGYSLNMRSIPFINMPTGTAVICYFSTSGDVNNLGDFRDCEGNPYEY